MYERYLWHPPCARTLTLSSSQTYVYINFIQLIEQTLLGWASKSIVESGVCIDAIFQVYSFCWFIRNISLSISHLLLKWYLEYDVEAMDSLLSFTDLYPLLNLIVLQIKDALCLQLSNVWGIPRLQSFDIAALEFHQSIVWFNGAAWYSQELLLLERERTVEK